MAAKKFLRLVSGIFTEIAGVVTSAGAGNAGDIVALDDTGKIDVSVLPTGVGAETVVVPASEALSDGDFVNLWDDSGTTKARKADASTTGKEANGFVLAGVSGGASATVYLSSQINTHRTGLTPAARYWLSDSTPGGITATPPTGAGKTSQIVGKASAAGTLIFNPEPAITLAA